MVDRDMELRHLAQAERHVADGSEHVARQKQIIAELERDGHGEAAATARELLKTLLETQALHESDRDHILSELGMPPQSN